MLVEQGASLQHVCFNKTIRQHIMENMPDLKLEGMARCRPPLAKQTSTTVLEHLAQIVDRVALGKVNFSEYTDKKENHFVKESSCIRKFRIEQLKSHI
jgi:hypothetical protein